MYYIFCSAIAHGEIEFRAESLDYESYYYYSKFTIGSKLPDWVGPQTRYKAFTDASKPIFVLHVRTSHTATCLVMYIYVGNV